MGARKVPRVFLKRKKRDFSRPLHCFSVVATSPTQCKPPVTAPAPSRRAHVENIGFRHILFTCRRATFPPALVATRPAALVRGVSPRVFDLRQNAQGAGGKLPNSVVMEWLSARASWLVLFSFAPCRGISRRPRALSDFESSYPTQTAPLRKSSSNRAVLVFWNSALTLCGENCTPRRARFADK